MAEAINPNSGRQQEDKVHIWSDGVGKISDCGLRIADFKGIVNLVFQSAIRNLKSAIGFAYTENIFKLFKILLVAD